MDGWDSDGGGGRLVDPFLMCNDGFMPRISPFEDFSSASGKALSGLLAFRSGRREAREPFYILSRREDNITELSPSFRIATSRKGGELLAK